MVDSVRASSGLKKNSDDFAISVSIHVKRDLMIWDGKESPVSVNLSWFGYPLEPQEMLHEIWTSIALMSPSAWNLVR